VFVPLAGRTRAGCGRTHVHGKVIACGQHDARTSLPSTIDDKHMGLEMVWQVLVTHTHTHTYMARQTPSTEQQQASGAKELSQNPPIKPMQRKHSPQLRTAVPKRMRLLQSQAGTIPCCRGNHGNEESEASAFDTSRVSRAHDRANTSVFKTSLTQMQGRRTFQISEKGTGHRSQEHSAKGRSPLAGQAQSMHKLVQRTTTTERQLIAELATMSPKQKVALTAGLCSHIDVHTHIQ
jgi:hypothetical protein